MKLVYSDGRETLDFAFSMAIASSIAVVSLTTNEEFGRNHLQSP